MDNSTAAEFLVRRVSDILWVSKGLYVECTVDGGVLAVWGSDDNMENIHVVTALPTPFRLICDTIPSRWKQHDRWLHERHTIYVIEPLADAANT